MSESVTIPRALERYPLGAAIEGGLARWNARDRERGRDVVVTRVVFGPSRKEERDAFVARVRSLYTVNSPALVAAFDAGPWEDDAFVVEDRVVEGQPIGALELDRRERSLAARAIAEGIAALHAAGWSLSPLDVVIDAYRQPRIGVAREAIEATAESREADLRELSAVVDSLAPPAPRVDSAAEMATAIVIADAPPPTPLVSASAPTKTPMLAWVVVIVMIVVIVAVAGYFGMH